jgi:hypothetical protein
MSARIASLATLMFVAVSWPSPAAACSCGGTVPSSTAAQHADVVFLGTVTRIDSPPPQSSFQYNADGSISGGAISVGPDLVIFDVIRVFKGTQVPVIEVVNSTSSCGFPFRVGEEWFIYGAEAKRPQGIVYGEVLRAPDLADNVQRAVLEPLQVIAASATQKFTTTTDPWGPFQLVLPPGDFEVWVERREKPVAQKRVVHVENGADVRVRLRAEYSDGDR